MDPGVRDEAHAGVVLHQQRGKQGTVEAEADVVAHLRWVTPGFAHSRPGPAPGIKTPDPTPPGPYIPRESGVWRSSPPSPLTLGYQTSSPTFEPTPLVLPTSRQEDPDSLFPRPQSWDFLLPRVRSEDPDSLFPDPRPWGTRLP